MLQDDCLAFYVAQSKYTDFGDFLPLIKNVPNDIEEIFKYSRNVIEHFHGINKNKIKPRRLLDVDIRYNKDILNRIKQCGYNDITNDIAFEDRIVGTCRTQAVFTCGILRAKGIPARTRYKYCTYFIEDFNHEQVLVEYWCHKKNRWLLGDPAMNHEVLQSKGISIHFDLCDVPQDKSMSIAAAWTNCRNKKTAPYFYGAYSKENKYNGYEHIHRKLYQDLACLNKIEVVEWDRWGIFLYNDTLDTEELSYCDDLATVLNVANLQDDALYRNINELKPHSIPVKGISASPFNADYEIIF
ncbi:MAG: hypothetical protein H0U75_07240 [Legionella sp.]|nr:hypothetical protein [Legionella sp.]